MNDKIGQLEINTAAGFRAEQSARQALAQQFASYQTTVNGQISQSQAYVLNQVAQNYATTQMVAQVNNQVASIQTTVSNLGPTITAQVTDQWGSWGLEIRNSWVTISASQTYITGNLQVSGSTRITGFLDLGNQVYMRDGRLGLGSLYIDGKTYKVVTWD